METFNSNLRDANDYGFRVEAQGRMAHVRFTRTGGSARSLVRGPGKEFRVEHIQGTLPDGEELVVVDAADADGINERLDPRGLSLRLRQQALRPQPAVAIPTGH